MIIRDILTVKNGVVFHIAPDAALADATRQMVENDVGSLVVQHNHSMVGLLTERDLLRAVNDHGPAYAGKAVQEYMTTEPIIGNPEDTVDYVRGVMTQFRISHLPVLEGEQLVGIISFHDVAKACLAEAKFENHLLKRYIRHWPE